MGSANLVSKIAAGGLSAGIFLIWWPGHVAADGLTQLVLRGLLWALVSELLLLTFRPLEELVTASLRGRIRVALPEPPAPARKGGAVVLASVGLLVPLLLLADPGVQPAPEPPAKPRVVKQVIVKRPVIKREVVVRPEVVAPVPQAAPAAAKPKTVVKRVVVERTKVVEKTLPAEPAAAVKAPAASSPAGSELPAAAAQDGDLVP